MSREKFTGFGKALAVKNRIHPDTFVQMALQLAYYRMHKKLVQHHKSFLVLSTVRTF